MRAVVSNIGELFYTLNKGKTNSKTLILFFNKLIIHLDTIDPFWRNITVLMIDNAPYHRSKRVLEYLKLYQLPVFFLGPY